MRGNNRAQPSGGMGIIGAIIIGIFLIAAAIAFALAQAVLVPQTDGGSSERLIDVEEKLLRLERRLNEQDRTIRNLRDRLEKVEATGGRRNSSDVAENVDLANLSTALHETEEPAQTFDSIDSARFNQGLTQANSRFMLEVLGNPRDSYSQECRGMTNPRLKAALETRQMGPVRVTMLRPALDSIERVLNRLAEEEPDLYVKLGTAGALCARFIRGSTRSISNHSWGTAIDLKMDGRLDRFGDGDVQAGLLIIAWAFNEEGWYWGGTWNREDAMHFEASQELIRRWVDASAL